MALFSKEVENVDEKGFFLGDIKTSNTIVVPSIKKKNENSLVTGKVGMGRKWGRKWKSKGIRR